MFWTFAKVLLTDLRNEADFVKLLFQALPGSGERVVLIQQTGVPAVKPTAEPTITHPQTPTPMI
jgi:hypothetical protein